LCELAPEGVRVDEVDERTLAADLDDRQPLPVALLELRHAGDVDLLELEPELLPERRQRGPCPVAEVAAGRAEQADLRYG
jgi:hypothetical protein